MSFYDLPLVDRHDPRPTVSLMDDIASFKTLDGRQAKVMMVRTQTSSQLRVIKTVRHSDVLRPPREAELLSNLSSFRPNIIRLFAAEHPIDGNATMSFEYCSGGDLFEQLTRFNKLGVPTPPVFAVHIWIGMSEALAFIHHGLTYSAQDGYTRDHTQACLLHRDIKDDNVFLRFPGSVPGLPDIVLGDFGFASLSHLAGNVAGAPHYRAPEINFHGLNTVTTASDVYSMGMMMYEVLVRGSAAWTRGMDPRYVILDPIYQGLPFRILLQGCLSIDPAKRAQMSEEAPWGILGVVKDLRVVREAMVSRGDRIGPSMWASLVRH